MACMTAVPATICYHCHCCMRGWLKAATPLPKPNRAFSEFVSEHLPLCSVCIWQSPRPPPPSLPRQSDDHGHLLTEQEARLATQVDFVIDLAGRVDGLSGWTQQAQQSFDKADTHFEQVRAVGWGRECTGGVAGGCCVWVVSNIYRGCAGVAWPLHASGSDRFRQCLGGNCVT